MRRRGISHAKNERFIWKAEMRDSASVLVIHATSIADQSLGRPGAAAIIRSFQN
jgi:hypothetical protein